jgi:hypothetical protein
MLLLVLLEPGFNIVSEPGQGVQRYRLREVTRRITPNPEGFDHDSFFIIVQVIPGVANLSVIRNSNNHSLPRNPGVITRRPRLLTLHVLPSELGKTFSDLLLTPVWVNQLEKIPFITP